MQAREPDVTQRPAYRLAEDLRAGRFGCRELLELCLGRYQAKNPAVNAVVFTDIDTARARADAADAALRRGDTWGPLHGLPMTVKDSFDVVGLPTTWGAREFQHNIAASTAETVRRLQRAGAVLWGKSNIAENLGDWQTSNPVYGTTHNPWAQGRTPGGSSGGAAAALATGMAAVEIGSDIGASIRNPAHYCGVFGHMPTYGVIPIDGHKRPGTIAEADLLVAGPLARSARDLQVLFDLLAGPAGEMARGWKLDLPRSPKVRLADFRVGVVYESPISAVDAPYRKLLVEMVRDLRAAGAVVDETARPEFDDRAYHQVYMHLLRAVTTAYQPPEHFEAALKAARMLEPGDIGYAATTIRATIQHHRDWIRVDEQRARLRHQWRAYFDSYDLLLCPVTASTAFELDVATPREERTIPVNGEQVDYNDQWFWAGLATLCGLPATVAPIGITEDAMPAGVQIIGPRLGDLETLAFAQAMERELGGFVPPPE